MKVAQINNSLFGSIGRIITSINQALDQHSINHHTFLSGGNKEDGITIFSNGLYRKANALYTKLSGRYGFECRMATHVLIQLLQDYDPDIILIHNIHGHDVDLKTLFIYLKNSRARVFWCFHDCWAFTGGCAYPKTCQKWKDQCINCPQLKKYSYFLDRSTANQNDKKRLFTASPIHIITPSNWMKELVDNSFLKNQTIDVIHNGINTGLFKPTPSNFKSEYGLTNKSILLVVANRLSVLKGIHDYIALANQLPKCYQLVLVGENSEDLTFPQNITHLPPIKDPSKLAEVYSAADCFINLTTADNFPTVNLEAQSCGTPVITYDIGGCKETVLSPYSCAVPYGDLKGVLTALTKVNKTPKIADSLHNAVNKNFNSTTQFDAYYQLFTNAINPD